MTRLFGTREQTLFGTRLLTIVTDLGSRDPMIRLMRRYGRTKCDNYTPKQNTCSHDIMISLLCERIFFITLDFSSPTFFSWIFENVMRELSGTTNYKSSMVADEHSRLRLSGEKATCCRSGYFLLCFPFFPCITLGLLSLAGKETAIELALAVCRGR